MVEINLEVFSGTELSLALRQVGLRSTHIAKTEMIKRIREEMATGGRGRQLESILLQMHRNTYQRPEVPAQP